MIQLLIAIVLGLAWPSNTDSDKGTPGDVVYSTNDSGGENGQIPPPPPPPIKVGE